MAASAGSGLGRGTLAAGAAVIAVVGIVGYSVIFAPGPDPVPQETPQGIASAPGLDSPEGATAEVTTDAVDTPTPDPATLAPRFDLVRVDAAGGALIAGQAEGNAELRLRLDGQEIHLASSDANGDFVAMFDIPPSELPRVLSLEMLMQDGSVLISDQSVIISPTLRVASAETGIAVESTEASGPDTPNDSGVTELALAEGAESPPASGSVPSAPATPDLPGQAESTGIAGSVADAPGQATQTAGLDSSGTDQPPIIGETEGAETEVTEIASAESLASSVEAPSRGLSSDNAEQSATAEAEGVEVANSTVPTATAEMPTAGALETAALEATADTSAVTPAVEATTDTPALEAASDTAALEATVDSPVAQDSITDPQLDSNAAGAEPGAIASNGDSPVATQSAGLASDATDLAVAGQGATVPEGGDPVTSQMMDSTAIAGSEPASGTSETGAETTTVVIAEAAESGTEIGAADVTEMAELAPETPMPTGLDVANGEAGAAASGEGEDHGAQTPPAEAGSSDSALTDVAAGSAGPSEPSAETQTAALDAASETGTPEAPAAAETTVTALVPQAPTVLLADREGIRVMQAGGSGPQVQAQVTLDIIAYDTGGEVVLTGRGRAESDVRFYLDNQPIHLAQINLQGGWRTQLPQVDPGTYTLRLDEVSADGAVQSRIETPFLREEPEAVAAITSASGENVITVQWGHTLWGIAQQHFGEGVAYVQIYEANRDQIRNPDLIYPGQIFTLPDPDAGD